MSNKTYDVMKLICQIILPFVTMVAAILSAFGLIEQGEIVLAIGTAINTFMGLFLKASSDIYWSKEGEKE